MEEYYRRVTLRTTLKLSTHLSPEEMRQAIAKATGRPLEQIPDIDLASALAEIRGQSNRVNQIIEKSKQLLDRNPKTTKDKYEELHDIGKFILAAGDNLTIEMPEKILKFPDFILRQEQLKIGVEHTRLMSEETKAIIKTVQYYIDKANELLKEDFGHLSKTVNIFVDFNKEVIGGHTFSSKGFSLKQRQVIPQIIAEYIKSELTGGNIVKPAFILQLEITPNKDSRVDLELGERYLTQDDFAKLLTTRIEKKEAKANNYRSVKSFDKLWLLVVIDDISSFSGFDIETAKIPIITESNFDAIFIFEKFSCRIFLIYNKPQ